MDQRNSNDDIPDAILIEPQNKGKYCPKCKDDYPEGENFCPNDGTSLAWHPVKKECPVCTQAYPLSVNFCTADGSSLRFTYPETVQKEVFIDINGESHPGTPLTDVEANKINRLVCPYCDAWKNWSGHGDKLICNSCKNVFTKSGNVFFSLGNVETTDTDIKNAGKNKLEGIGGWLILLAFGIVVSPIRLSIQLLTTYPKMFSDGTWEAITIKSSYSYYPQFAYALVAEIVINVCIILTIIYVAYLLFNKKKAFPKWFITITIISLVFIVGDMLVFAQLFPNEPILDPKASKELARSLLGAIIWIPYVLLSERVKVTFVK